MHVGFHEGLVCNAVLRLIEMREGATRRNCRSPKVERDAAPVELVCEVGGQQFAFEHTGIEPFEGHVRLQNDAVTHFRPLEDRLSVSLPPDEYIELHMPLKATEGLRGDVLAATQDALVAYVIAKAPTLPFAREGRYVLPIQLEQPAGVTFEVSLHRWHRSWQAKQFAIVQKMDIDLEAERRKRILRACKKKFPKLANWQNRGAKSILILEDNDIQNTGDSFVAEAVLAVEQNAGCKPPDEIYLVTTFSSTWFANVIRIGNKTYFDFEDYHGRTWEIDPLTLNDPTKQGYS